ncbi:cytochrome P450 [Coleofasciculus sp.]|uniref:cytochrome P450 n=1 Tax=Coleofasciculus sp. TaxID=3100458 RepID=UPI0039F88F99
MTTTDELKSRPLPPGHFGLPLIGETIQFFRDPDFAKKRHQKYGSIFKTKLFGRPTVMISGSEANRFVLTHENQYSR